jgi:hypothetical protein
VQELVGDGPGACGGAVLGREDVGVAEGSLNLRVGGVVAGCGVFAGLVAAEPVVHAVSPDGVEESVHAVAIEIQKLLHGGDAFGVEALFRAGADAGKIAEFEVSDGARELRGKKADETIGLLHIAGDLGEVAVGRHADGAAEGLADMFIDGLLDVESDAAGAGRFALATEELADHLVDGGRVGDGADEVDGFGDAAGEVGVVIVAAVDEDDAGTLLLGFADLGAGSDAEGFGLVAGGDAAGGVSDGGDDGEGTVAVGGVEMLLDGGEEGVEIDVEEGELLLGDVREVVGLEDIRHKRIIFAFCLLLRPETKTNTEVLRFAQDDGAK